MCFASTHHRKNKLAYVIVALSFHKWYTAYASKRFHLYGGATVLDEGLCSALIVQSTGSNPFTPNLLWHESSISKNGPDFVTLYDKRGQYALIPRESLNIHSILPFILKKYFFLHLTDFCIATLDRVFLTDIIIQNFFEQ